MMLTGLEVALLAGAVASVTGVGVKLLCDKGYVTRLECRNWRETCLVRELGEKIDRVESRQDEQSKMIRLVLAKLRVPIEDQIKMEGT